MAVEGSLIDFSDEPPTVAAAATTDPSDSTDTGAATVNSSKFEENFWGPECRGFEALLNNLKAGVSAAHHIGEYVKERISLEKSYVRGLQKLSKSLGQVPDNTLGSFHSLWLVMLKTLDVVSISREKRVTSLSELSKEISEYTSKQDDQLKGKLKGEIDAAHKSLNGYRHSTEVVRKSRKAYSSSCFELTEQQRDLERAKLDPNKAKDVEKLEAKLRKAHTHVEQSKTEYQKAITTYHGQWNDFEGKMVTACRKFQSLEEQHLKIMRSFMSRSSNQEESELEMFREYNKLREKIKGMPVEKLLSIFTQLKGTGKRKPELLQFVPIEIGSLQLAHSGSLDSISSAASASTAATAKKAKTKKVKKPKNKAPPPPTASTASAASETTPPKDENVDEEGFTIRPKDADKIAKFSDEESNDSESDSDSDPEAETGKKIQALTIKAQSVAEAASVDELSKAAKMLKLEAPSTPGMKRAGSTQSLNTTTISSLTPQMRHASPVGSQSLFNQPIDHGSTPPDSAPLSPTLNATAPASSSSWQPNFDESLPPPIATQSFNWATFTPAKTPPTVAKTTPTLATTPPTPKANSVPVSPVMSSFPTQGFASFNNGTGDSSPKIAAKPPLPPGALNSILPPPPAGGAQRPRLAEGYKSEPSSPMMSIRSLSPAQSPGSASEQRKFLSRPSSGTTLDVTHASLSPLATTAHQRSTTVSGDSVTTGTTAATETGTAATAGVTVPIAVAFIETCNAIYKGSDLSKTVVKVTGQMDFSFPSSFISSLSSHTPLQFTLQNTQNIARILHNQNLITQEKEGVYVFQMPKLASHLKQLTDQSAAPFHNIQALKYEVSITKSNFLPLQMTSFWKCDPTVTTFRLDYTYTPDVFPAHTKPNLTGLMVTLTVGGGVTRVESQPNGVWSSDKSVMAWKLPDVSGSQEADTCTLKSRFELSSGPSLPTPAIIQFVCDGSTVSGISMKLDNSGYKISLQKDKCVSGKYMAEPVK